MATKVYNTTANQGGTTILGALTSVATSIPLAVGGVAALGLTGLSSPDFTHLTLFQTPLTSPPAFEIVKVTSLSGDTLTVTRAQEGTTGLAFDNGEPIEITITSGMYQDLVNTLIDGTAEIAVGPSITSNGVLITNADGELEHLGGDDQIKDTVTISLADNVVVTGGGVLWTGTGLAFDVAATSYWIDGVKYDSVAATVTLATEDASNDRIDLIIVNTTPGSGVGTATKITGTPAATPVAPSHDPTSELILATITVNDSGGGGGVAVTSETIYDEDDETGPPTEWAATASDSSHVVDSTNDFNTGAKSVEATGAAAGDSVSFVDQAVFDISTFGTISLYIKPKAAFATNKRVLGSFWLAGVSVSDTVIFAKDTEADFDSTSNTWQQLIRDISAFGLTTGSPDEFRIEVAGGGAAIGYFIDTIIMQTIDPATVLVPHAIADHIDTVATGANLNVLVGGDETDLHTHLVVNLDTTATGANLNTLTGGGASNADALHTHLVDAADWASPGTIGSTAANTGAFTTLSTSGLATLASASVTANLDAATIGGGTPGTGAFSTLSTSGLATLASASVTANLDAATIGAGTPGTGAFSTLSTSGLATLASASVTANLDAATIGGGTPGTGAFSTLSASGLATLGSLDIITGVTTDSKFHLGEIAGEGCWITTESDNQTVISGGAERVSGSWIARSTEASLIHQSSGNIVFYTDTSLVDGNSFTETQRVSIAAADGQLTVITGDIVVSVGDIIATLGSLTIAGAATFNAGAGNVDFQIGSDGTATAFKIDADGSDQTNGLITTAVPFQATRGFGRHGISANTALTIASDDLTIDDEDDWIDVSPAAGSDPLDDLDTIINGYDGQEIVLQAPVGKTITIRHLTAGAGRQIVTQGGTNVSLFGLQMINLRRNGTIWYAGF